MRSGQHPPGLVLQIYPRSFQDSDGDGIGDLRGVESRLDHVSELGADAIWLSPINPSPLADFGYDVSDFCGVDEVFGTLADLDGLIEAAHARGIRVLLDLVPCHTSIEHPWFREHPDRYIWADGRDGDPPNNWIATFGGPAWTYSPERERWYLHSFYPEQPDLDWRNPEVVDAMQAVVRFWLARGVDGFRLDALDRLVKDEQLRDDPPAATAFALPLHEDLARLARVFSGNRPEASHALAALRAAAGDALLVGEVYLPAADLEAYLEHLDAVFAFDLFHAPWDATALRQAVEGCLALTARGGTPGAAWVLSNHDFSRIATRAGEENARAAAVLLHTLPGTTFLYQGEEIGQIDGPRGASSFDRAGRDPYRHPVQWEADPERAGFTTGEPWLPPVDAASRNVADQRGDPASMLGLHRRLVALRPELGEELSFVDDCAESVLAFSRGEHLVAVNTGDRPAPVPAPDSGAAVLESEPGALAGGLLAPHTAAITRG